MSFGPKQTLQEGFEKFVVKNPEGCWEWKGCRPKNPGYGQFRHGSKLERAHRASWMIHFGDIPKGIFVLHKCDNHECSNPEHLFLGTNLDNIKDMLSKNRHPTIGKKGNNLGKRLNEDQVREIRKLGSEKNISAKEMATLFKVNPVTIREILRINSWKDLQ
jgi:hypothetical protein